MNYELRKRKNNLLAALIRGLKFVIHNSAFVIFFFASVAVAQESSPPAWSCHAVWYQIFPTRFRNGDTTNDPPHTVPWNHDWDTPAPTESLPPFNGSDGNLDSQFGAWWFIQLSWRQEVYALQCRGKLTHDQSMRRYGGDLEGIRQSLPYLRDLGVTGIYLNPIFVALTEHKYDTCDYRHIDDSLGVKDSRSKLSGEIVTNPSTWQWSDSDRVFLRLLNEAHQKGIKIVIDGVFNHVGPKFEPWLDVRKNGRNSPYASWFEIIDWGPPLRWKSWFGENGDLIFMRKTADGMDPAYEKYLFDIARRWMDPNGDGDPSDGVDGWRLDAPQFIPHGFWKRWRTHVKSINPEALIVGESWEDTTPWLGGDEWDVATNYPFAYDVFALVADEHKDPTIEEFWNRRQKAISSLGQPRAEAMWNLLDSHDTDRLASMMVNPDRPYNQFNNPGFDPPSRDYKTRRPNSEEYDRAKLALAIQFTSIGAPLIYYGTELGMFGARDPHDRKPMLWADAVPNDNPQEYINPDMLDWIRRLSAIRNTYSCLSTGSIEPAFLDNPHRILAYYRTDSQHRILVLINLSDDSFSRKLDDQIFDFTPVDLLQQGTSSTVSPSRGKRETGPQPIVTQDIKDGPPQQLPHFSLPPRSCSILLIR